MIYDKYIQQIQGDDILASWQDIQNDLTLWA